MSEDLWTYGLDPARSTAETTDIVGFGVEAEDGSIGKIDSATYETGASQIVVDTGPWIFGKKVMLPAGVIERIDCDEQTVWVNRSKDEIKHAPELGEELDDAAYRAELGSYYGAGSVDATRERVGPGM